MGVASEWEKKLGRMGLADGAGDAKVEVGLGNEVELRDRQAKPENLAKAIGLGDGLDFPVAFFLGRLTARVLSIGDEEPVNVPALIAAAKQSASRAECFVVRVGGDDEDGAGLLGVDGVSPSEVKIRYKAPD